ncbi:MAG: class I SAM-dependent methyltransferase [Terriglobales bacterium]
MWADYRLFWSQWRRRFVQTGAVAPSSRTLARSMAGPMARRPAARIRVLEVGAGTGVFTREILRQMRGGDSLRIYEINPEFCDYLERVLRASNWPQRDLDVELRRADIHALAAGENFDFVICGLPFNNFEPATVAEIMQLLLGHLTENGVFSYFEYLGLRGLRQWLLRSGPEHERVRTIGEIMGELLRRHQFRSEEVWLNLPPAATHHLALEPARRPSLSRA